MGAPDFRVDGRIFATLAHQRDGYGNLMLDAAHQADFLAEAPDVFLPVHGGWGRMGATHIRLAAATEDILYGALHTAWTLRAQKNEAARKPSAKSAAPNPRPRKPRPPTSRTRLN